MKRGQQSERINPWKLFHGAFVPNWLLCRHEPNPGAKLCYARLLQFAGSKGICHPKQATLAQELGVSPRQIRKYIAELEGLRLIGSEKKWKLNHYFFLRHPWIEAGISQRNSSSSDNGDSQRNSSSSHHGNSSSPDKRNHSSSHKRRDSKEEIQKGVQPPPKSKRMVTPVSGYLIIALEKRIKALDSEIQGLSDRIHDAEGSQRVELKQERQNLRARRDQMQLKLDEALISAAGDGAPQPANGEAL